MKNIAKTPEFIQNEFTISFLKQTDEKKFNLKKKEGDLWQKPSKIEDHMNLEGKAEVRITQEHKLFSHYVSEYIDATTTVYFK